MTADLKDPPKVLTQGQSQCDVALVFVDLAGFSDLSARLVAADIRGAEAIHTTLNPMISAVMTSITWHGGVLIGLHGDAVAAVWPPGLAQDALACATQLGQVVRDAAPGDAALPLRTLVDAGPLTRIDRPGSPLFAGPVLAALAQQAPQVQAGQIVQTSAFERLLGQEDGARSLPTEWSTPPSEMAETTWLAEFRNTTVLFVQIRSEPGQDVAATQDLAAGCDVAVSRHGGQVLQLATDDKGLVALLGWGLARTATEEDADLAIAAARALKTVLHSRGLSANFSLGQGRSLSGVLGTQEHGHYTVLGDHVNRAAGAMSLSCGAILCDAAVQAAATRFKFDTPIPFTSKTGQTFQVAAAKNETARVLRFESQLIGRQAERDMLAQFADETVDQPGVLWLSGDAGVGKSHLVSEWADGLAQTGVTVLRGVGDRLGQLTAYRLWQPVFGAFNASPDLPVEARAYGALLNPVLPGFAEHTVETDGLSPVARSQRSQELMAQVLAQHLRGCRAVLVLEDVHWMDTPSWLLLGEVHRRVPNLRVLAVSRPRARDALSQEAQAILFDPDTQHLHLGPLDARDGAALVQAIFAAEHVAVPLTQRVLAHTGGHPLYTVELVRNLLENGSVRVENGHCVVTTAGGDLQGLAFPNGIEAAITARISQLRPEDQLVLKIASVQGRRFQAAPIEAADFTGLGGDQVVAGLARLAQAALVEPDPLGAWRFHHALMREAAYDLLTRDQARALHAVTAEVLEPQAEAAVMAYHWSAAQDPARALPWLDQAATQAQSADANADALSFVNQAFAAARQLDGGAVAATSALRWHGIATKSALLLGLHDDAVDHGSRALNRTGHGMPRATVRQVGRLLREVARYKKFGATAPAQIATPEPQGQIAVRNHLFLTEVYYDRQDTLNLLLHGIAAMNVAYRTDSRSDEAALAHSSMAMLGFHAPFIAKGDPHMAAALALAPNASPATATRVRLIAGNYHMGAGRWAEGRDELTQSVRLAEETREFRNGTIALASLANLVRLEGQIAESDAHDVAVFSIGQDRSTSQFQIWAMAGRVKSLSRLNDWDGFDRVMAQHKALMSYGPNWDNSSLNARIVIDLCGAVRDLHFGATRDGKDKLLRAAEMYRSAGQLQTFSIDLAGYFGDALLRLEEQAPGAPETRGVAKLMAKRGRGVSRVYPPAKPRAIMAKGDYAWTCGKVEQAQKRWAEAETAALALAMPFDAAAAADRLATIGDSAAAARRDVALGLAGIDLPEIWRGA